MKRVLLLEGPRACGKSTMILQALGGALPWAGGYMTLRVEQGDRRGYAHRLPKDMTGVDARAFEPQERGVFLIRENGRVQRREEALLSFTLPLLRGIGSHPFAVLDEVGGYELTLAPFREALYAAFGGSTPIVGVLKSRENSLGMARRAGLDDAYLAAYDAFRRYLEACAQVVNVQTAGKQAAREALSLWRDAFVGGGLA